MKQYMPYILAFILILSPAFGARAAVITVDGGGSGDYLDIQSAVDAAQTNDEIHVAAGTYTENVVFDNLTTPDNIKLYGGYESTGWTRDISANVTVIDGGGVDSTVSVIGVSGVEIDGFTIRGSAASGIVAGVYVYAASPAITNNIIESNGRHGVYVESVSSPAVEKNLIVSNSYYGIYCYSFGGGGVPLLYNNTIDQNKTGINLYAFSPNIYNNIITSNTDYGISNNIFSAPTINYNCVWNNGIDDYYNAAAGDRDISVDPLYIGGGDYGLQESPTVSDCVDAGIDVGLAFNGHLPDMGAYESNAAIGVPWPPTGLAASPLSAKAYLTWDANQEAGLAGYMVDYGTVSGIYTDTVDVGNVTDAAIENLTNEAGYYFAVRAYFDGTHISDYSNEASATPTNGDPELPHYAWDSSFGTDCTNCHYTQDGGDLLPSGFDYRFSTELCISCHNSTGTARGKLIDRSLSHPVFVNVTSGGNQMPVYGAVTGRYSNRMADALKDGDTVVCVTCHNIMEKPESPGRTWEYTTFSGKDAWKTYNLDKGGWAYYDFAEPVVYGSETLTAKPTDIKTRREYLLTGNYLSDFSPSAGTIKFNSPYFDYAYVTLYYPYLRVSNSENNLCSDCHASHQTHQGANCMTCHQAHNYDNLLGVKARVKTPKSGIKSVVFTSTTSTGSFADGDNVYDGICEVCHTLTLYNRNNGTGFTNHTSTGINYSGTDCTACHTHANGFSP